MDESMQCNDLGQLDDYGETRAVLP